MSTDTYEFQSLKEAIYQNRVQTIQHYVRLSDPNIEYINKGLIIASQCGRLEIARLFMEKRITAETLGKSLEVAVENNNIDILKILIEKDIENKRQKYSYENNDILTKLLTQVIKAKKLEFISLLETSYADIGPAIFEAVKNKYDIEIIKRLLPDEHRLERYSFKILQICCQIDNFEVLQYMIGERHIEYDDDIINSAICWDRLHFLDYFESLGTDLSDPKYIQQACSGKKDRTLVIEYFNKKGAKIYDDSLFTAVNFGNFDIVKLFVDKGGDIFTQDNKALMLACSHKKVKIVEYIVPLVMNKNENVTSILNNCLDAVNDDSSNNNYDKKKVIIEYIKEKLLEFYSRCPIKELHNKYISFIDTVNLNKLEILVSNESITNRMDRNILNQGLKLASSKNLVKIVEILNNKIYFESCEEAFLCALENIHVDTVYFFMNRRSDISCKHKELFKLAGKCGDWEEACKIYLENIKVESVKSAHLPLSEFLETLEENQQHKTDNKCIIC